MSWDQDRFFEQARGLASKRVDALRELYEFFRPPEWVVRHGNGKTWGTFLPTYRPLSTTSAVATIETDGDIYFNFDYFPADSESMKRLARELRRRFKIKLPRDLSRRTPHLRSDQWVPRLSELKDAFRAAFPD
jgi:hypothetical protein